jgi:TonB family protein
MPIRPLLLASVLTVLAAGVGNACLPPLPFQPNDLISNQTWYSENRRYCVVERWYEKVEDFKTARAGTALGLDLPEPPAPVARKELKFVLYESETRKRLAEYSLPFTDRWLTTVSDSGRYVVFEEIPGGGPCAPAYPTAEATLVTIVRSDGTTVGHVKLGDVLTEDDIASEARFGAPSIRSESDTHEVLVLDIEGHERRVELETAKLRDPKADILPKPVVSADAAARRRDFDDRDPFEERSAVHLTSEEVLARALDKPLPAFPDMARGARAEDTVWVQVVVSESGDVVALRSTPSFDGLKEAAIKSLHEWRFRPLSVHGHNVPFTGEVAIHFAHKAAP